MSASLATTAAKVRSLAKDSQIKFQPHARRINRKRHRGREGASNRNFSNSPNVSVTLMTQRKPSASAMNSGEWFSVTDAQDRVLGESACKRPSASRSTACAKGLSASRTSTSFACGLHCNREFWKGTGIRTSAHSKFAVAALIPRRSYYSPRPQKARHFRTVAIKSWRPNSLHTRPKNDLKDLARLRKTLPQGTAGTTANVCTSIASARSPKKNGSVFAPKEPFEIAAKKKQLVGAGRSQGILVYANNEPVGWCQYGPQEKLPRIDTIRNYRAHAHAPAPQKLWRITCFVVLKNHRKQGVATAAKKPLSPPSKKKAAALSKPIPLPPGNPAPSATSPLTAPPPCS